MDSEYGHQANPSDSDLGHQASGNNGGLPADDLDGAVHTLMTASADLRRRHHELTAELAQVKDRLGRYDSAIRALTRETKPGRPRAEAEQETVKRTRRRKADPNSTAAEGYPAVSVERQDVILNALRAMPHPVSPSELADSLGMARSSVQNGLGHLRARGLIRWAGKGARGAGKYTTFDDITLDTEGSA
jgi:CRP-like cAMP-binding protein